MSLKITLLIFLLILLAAPVFVWAAHGGDHPAPSPPPGGGGGIQNPLQAKDLTELLNNIINFLLTMAGSIAVIMVIAAGYMFVTAGDNADQVKKARKTLLYTAVGIFILVMSKALVYVICDVIGATCTL